ncbi:hypothetical protein KC573_02175 [candidate division WWE3 bacterium]|uniref:Uncharacterized protein n=1 Tax=candidate division WWE3 bacterium TaxID=2053526 RepID=A0A955LWQ5_UNCKA|nr:hypothetical protein [candidate division WWE3 bacterium]
MVPIAAAMIAVFTLFSLSLFQVGLIAKKPWGKLAWGGNYQVLPDKLRIASVASIAIYILFAVVFLEKAGLISVINNEAYTQNAMWFVAIYSGLGIFLNAISRSPLERKVMTPVALVLGVCALILALG